MVVPHTVKYLTSRFSFHVIGHHLVRDVKAVDVTDVAVSNDDEHEYAVVKAYLVGHNYRYDPLYVVKDKKTVPIGPHKRNRLGELLMRNINVFKVHRNILFIVRFSWKPTPHHRYLIINMRTGDFIDGNLSQLLSQYRDASFSRPTIVVDKRSDEETAIFHVFFNYKVKYGEKYGFITFKVSTKGSGVELIESPTITDNLDLTTARRLLGLGPKFASQDGPFTRATVRPKNSIFSLCWAKADVNLSFYFSNEDAHSNIEHPIRFMVYNDPSDPLLDVPVLPIETDELRIKDYYVMKSTFIDGSVASFTENSLVVHIQGKWEVRQGRYEAGKVYTHTIVKIVMEDDGVINIERIINIYHPEPSVEDIVSAKNTKILVPKGRSDMDKVNHARFVEPDGTVRMLDLVSYEIIEAELPLNVVKTMQASSTAYLYHLHANLYLLTSVSMDEKLVNLVFLRLDEKTEQMDHETEASELGRVAWKKREREEVAIPRIKFKL